MVWRVWEGGALIHWHCAERFFFGGIYETDAWDGYEPLVLSIPDSMKAALYDIWDKSEISHYSANLSLHKFKPVSS